MEHFYCAQYEDALLRPLHRYDIEYLRQWRNKCELNQYLKAVGDITEQMQEKWFETYIKDRDTVLWSIDYMRIRSVGTVALYDFQDNRCQIGKILIGDDAARGHGLGRLSFLMAMRMGMEFWGIRKFFLSVHEDNRAARAIYDKIGFYRTGSHSFERGGMELEMEITAEKMMEKNQETKKISLFKENAFKVKTICVWGGGKM